MAYVSVAQGEHEPSPALSSTLPEISSTSLSGMFDDDLPANTTEHDHPSLTQQTPGVGSLLKSLTSSTHSYEMVEDDDYEEPINLQESLKTPRQEHFPDLDTSTTPYQPPLRTASISRHLPMNHPTPDLQSLQGAYLKNVERLEETAERLSLTSTLEDELQRIKVDQRNRERVSSGSSRGSASRPPVAHRKNSTASVGRVKRRITNGSTSSSHNGHFSQNIGEIKQQNDVPEISERSSLHAYEESPREDIIEGDNGEERPQTSASNDASRKSNDLFDDFDGVHYSGSMRSATTRHISLNHPPRARDSRAFREPQPGQQMIYYPAPVPVMLNLPQRLSKMDFAERDRRRSKALSMIPDEMKRAAPWLSHEDTVSDLTNTNRRLSAMPPQLRASAFFDQSSLTPNLQLKDGSAVATLDSILDASAFAPVSAFTDHPITGHLGSEVYGSAPIRKSMQPTADKPNKRRSSFGNMLKKHASTSALSLDANSHLKSRESKVLESGDVASGDELDQAAAESIAPGEDEIVDGDDSNPEEEEEEDDEIESEAEYEHQQGFSGAPTTLLAELQMRKEQQKRRNRTAADAFPNGMHSTLLELDAVAQLQQKSRKQKHVTLAWEDHEAADRENFDDEDVPLGVLFPDKDKTARADINRPMGLMEKREMEDNEPLSHRRARLRGEPIQIPQIENPMKTAQSVVDDKTAYTIDLPPTSDTLIPEQEEESLAQRLKRMREERARQSAADFADEVSGQLGLKAEEEKQDRSKTPDVEETLGQRRKRLQEDASQSQPSQLKPRRSMADILQAHPAGGSTMPIQEPNNWRFGGQLPRASTYGALTSYGMPQMPTHMTSFPSYQNNLPYANLGYNNSTPMLYGSAHGMTGPMAMNGLQYGYGMGMQDPMMGPPLDPKQRALIDRWRQGVV